ncbi:MAG: hypothetical protein GY869_22115, partial [Planctomycetes bacterium]|nr:hypothetical protein [Planctomycetota bacterium]
MKKKATVKTDHVAFSKKLLSYSILAGMAISLPPANANAAIVYTDVDPDVTLVTSPGCNQYHVDFDGDGQGEFQIRGCNGNEGAVWTLFTLFPNAFGQGHSSSWYMYQYGIMVQSYGGGDALRLNQNDVISGAKDFYYNIQLFDGWPEMNNWKSTPDPGKYMGVKFVLGLTTPPHPGHTVHYGWVRMTAGDNYDWVKVLDFAYETTPGQSILAGALPTSNNAPTLTNLSPSITYAENTVNATPQIIDSAVTFADADGGDLDTGALTITGIRASETISVENQAVGSSGNIRRSGNNIQVSNGTTWTTCGVVDGTDTGAGTNLKITLNANAAPTNVD